MHRLCQLTRLFAKNANPWVCALQLMVMNVLLAVFCSGTFVGGIQLVAWVNHRRLAMDHAASEMPFPYPVLLILYAILFIAASRWFAKRLAPLPSRGKLIAAGIGISPIFGLALLGYVTVAAMIFIGGNNLPPGAPWVCGAASTLILFAAGAEMLLILMLSQRHVNSADVPEF